MPTRVGTCGYLDMSGKHANRMDVVFFALTPSDRFWKWFEASPLSDFNCRYKDYEFRDILTDEWRLVYRHVYN